MNTDGRRLRTGLAAAFVAGLLLWPGAPVWLQWRCPFRALTGLDCPGCGGTRAVRALLAGHLAGAFQSNALVAALAIGAMAWAALALARYWRTGNRPDLTIRPGVAYALAAVTVGFGVFRNL